MVFLWYLYGIYFGGRAEKLLFIIGSWIYSCFCNIEKEKSVQQTSAKRISTL